MAKLKARLGKHITLTGKHAVSKDANGMPDVRAKHNEVVELKGYAADSHVVISARHGKYIVLKGSTKGRNVKLRAEHKKDVIIGGVFGIPVVVGLDTPETLNVEFGTDWQDVPMMETLVYNTTAGSFEAEITEWDGIYSSIVQGTHEMTAVYDLFPMFKGKPEFVQPVNVKMFRTSSGNILASNDEINV